MKKWCLYFLLSLACCAGRAQVQQCAEDLKKERLEKLTSLHVGDSMVPIEQRSFKVAVVVFWKTDCPYCEKLMPQLETLSAEYKADALSIIAICLDSDLGSRGGR